MNFTVPAREFRQAFSTAGRFIPQKSVKAVYNNSAKIIADPSSGLTIIGRNPEGSVSSGIIYRVPGVTVNIPGIALVPRGKIDELLSVAKNETLSFSLSDGRLEVTGARAVWKIAIEHDPNLFADPPDLEESTFAILASDLAVALGRTSFACNPDIPQHCLGGVWIDPRADHVLFHATDGRIICRARADADGEAPQSGPGGQPIQYILPQESCRALAFAMGQDGESVQVGFSNGCLVAKRDGITVSFTLLQGVFPSYDRAMMPEDGGSADVNAAFMLETVEQAAVMVGVSSNMIRFDFRPEPGPSLVSAVASETGSSVVEFPIPWEGPPAVVGFTPGQVRDILRSIGDDAARIAVTGGGKQLTIRATDYDTWIMGGTLPAAVAPQAPQGVGKTAQAPRVATQSQDSQADLPAKPKGRGKGKSKVVKAEPEPEMAGVGGGMDDSGMAGVGDSEDDI
jgi:DNA polymerase III sliding clamp (beta) subunit (PCNA family)